MYFLLSRRAQILVSFPAFDYFWTLIICFAVFSEGAIVDNKKSFFFQKVDTGIKLSENKAIYASAFQISNILITLLFTLEIGLKILAEGLRWKRYFRTWLNCIDFGVTITMFVAF